MSAPIIHEETRLFSNSLAITQPESETEVCARNTELRPSSADPRSQDKCEYMLTFPFGTSAFKLVMMDVM